MTSKILNTQGVLLIAIGETGRRAGLGKALFWPITFESLGRYSGRAVQ